MMKPVLALTVTWMVLVTAMAGTAFAASKTNQVSIRYEPPKNPAHQEVYTELMQRGVLEKLQIFFSPFRLPRTLQISLAGCDGEADAFYEDDAITICYELVDDWWKNMSKEATPVFSITPSDTVFGPFYEVSLHEFGHALFDMLELPVFGREEVAADQIAAYILLQFGESEVRRLITGAAYAYEIDERKTEGSRTREDYADEHDTPAQRFFNILCIAYGANAKLFDDVVRKGYLPKARAEYCDEEYEQVKEAFEILVHPHMDLVLAKEILDTPWFEVPNQ